jgi:hypothetical protein
VLAGAEVLPASAISTGYFQLHPKWFSVPGLLPSLLLQRAMIFKNHILFFF